MDKHPQCVANDSAALVQQIAIAKAVKEKDFEFAKKALVDGYEGEVNFLVRIQGSVKKGFETTTLSWPKAKFDTLAAILFSTVNEATREKVLAEYRDHLSGKGDGEVLERIKKEAEKAIQKVMGETEVVRAGTVTAKLTAEIVPEA